MKKILVHKRAYRVRAHWATSKSGKRYFVPSHYIKSTSYKMKDLGRPGRGKKVIPKLKRGGLGGKGFFKKSYGSQKRTVFNVAKVKGERTAIGRLSALQNFFKNTKPNYSARAKKLRRVVAGSFVGRRKVLFPQGFSRSYSR